MSKKHEAEMQDELFIVRTREPEQDSHPRISQLVKDYKSGALQKPLFQRDYVWDDVKLKGWVNSIMNHTSIGAIVTYQIDGSGPVFLADGLQRITATQLFLENPQGYDFDFGKQQAESYCASFSVTRQHRHYKSHQDARSAFQNLNKGTAATPVEFHKGDIVLVPRGKLIYEHVPAIVESLETPLLSGRSANRLVQSRRFRDCLGLFLQYASGFSGVTFYDVGKFQEDGGKLSVEARLANYIKEEGWTERIAKQKMKGFKLFLASQIAVIETVVKKTHPSESDKSFNAATMRWLLHLAIWRKNTGRTVERHIAFLEKLLNALKPYDSFTSRFLLPGSETEFITLHTDNLSFLKKLCVALGSDLHDEVPKRRKRNTRPGYDAGHEEPFAISGEGATVPEPASINRARGMKPMEKNASVLQPDTD